MKVAVFGISSPSGQKFADQALAAGHVLRALLRDPAKMPVRGGLTVLAGDALDGARVEETVSGTDAVVSYLGPGKGAPANLVEVTTGNLINAMRKQGVKRLVMASVAGIRQPQDPPSLFGSIVDPILRVLIRNMYQQRLRQLELLRASDLDWVAIRLPRLVNTPGSGAWSLGYPKMSAKLVLSREDLADIMLQQLSDTTWLRQAPVAGISAAF